MIKELLMYTVKKTDYSACASDADPVESGGNSLFSHVASQDVCLSCMKAIRHDDAKRLACILSNLPKVDFSIDALNRTLLYFSAQKGSTHCVKLLLQYGAKDTLLAQSEYAQYAIGIAAYYNHAEIVSLLAVLATKKGLFDALRAAARKNHVNIVQYLLSHYSAYYPQAELEQVLYLSIHLSHSVITEQLLIFCKEAGMPNHIREGWIECAIKKGLIRNASYFICKSTNTASIKQSLINLIYA